MLAYIVSNLSFHFVSSPCLKFCAIVLKETGFQVGCEAVRGSVKLQEQLGGSFQYAKGVLRPRETSHHQCLGEATEPDTGSK